MSSCLSVSAGDTLISTICWTSSGGLYCQFWDHQGLLPWLWIPLPPLAFPLCPGPDTLPFWTQLPLQLDPSKSQNGARETVSSEEQWLFFQRTEVLVPPTSVSNICNSSYKGSDASFWSLQALHTQCRCTQRQNNCIHKKKLIALIFKSLQVCSEVDKHFFLHLMIQSFDFSNESKTKLNGGLGNKSISFSQFTKCRVLGRWLS